MESLLNPAIISCIVYWSNDPHYHILSDRKGKIIAIRHEGPKRRSAWLIEFSRWFDKDFPGPFEALKIISDTTDYLGVGTKPTPGSLGKETMRYIYELYNIRRRHCLPIACESYLSEHGFGGVMQSNFVGDTIPEVIQLDGASKYVSEWYRHPDGTPVWCTGSWIHDYATFFARVSVTIPFDLPMGLFPVRAKDWSVIYPTRKGRYTTFLWRERVDELNELGIQCKTKQGWAWPCITEDNVEWKKWMFDKRINAPTPEIERMTKKVAVSAIGSFLRGRDNFCIVGPERYSPEYDVPVLDGDIPLDLWVHRDYDFRSAIMPHWTLSSIDRANSDLIDISYPFSIKDQMVLLDVDSVFVNGVSTITDSYSSKGSVIPYAGQWLWKRHHNFRVLRHRMWVSDEEPSRYGSLLDRIA